MVCLNNKNAYEKIKSLSFHGWNIDPWIRHNKSFEKIYPLSIGIMRS